MQHPRSLNMSTFTTLAVTRPTQVDVLSLVSAWKEAQTQLDSFRRDISRCEAPEDAARRLFPLFQKACSTSEDFDLGYQDLNSSYETPTR
jgi:hypothetical protein